MSHGFLATTSECVPLLEAADHDNEDVCSSDFPKSVDVSDFAPDGEC